MKLHGNWYALANVKLYPEKAKRGSFPIRDFEARKLNNDNFEIYWTMNGFEWGKRTRQDLLYINCFYADLDVGTHEEMQNRIRGHLEPSAIIKTGRGYQCYWYLEKEIECNNNPVQFADWFKEFQSNRIVPALNSDPNAADACRLLRVPFYKYWKDGLGEKYIDIVYDNSNFYRLETIEKYFPVLKKEEIYIPKQITNKSKGSLWEKAASLPIRESLESLSGTKHVNGDVYTFKKEAGGRQRIYINGERRNGWIEKDGHLGSRDAGPNIQKWLYWYHRDWKKVAEIIKEVFKIEEK